MSKIDCINYDEGDIELDIIRNSEGKRLDTEKIHVPENYKLHRRV
jgi:hypothetical protein